MTCWHGPRAGNTEASTESRIPALFSVGLEPEQQVWCAPTSLTPWWLQVRRKADPAKEFVKEFVSRWRDDPLVTQQGSHAEIKG
jgi:hypothetical protein